ncbi:glycoside hydrolase family 16 protein [Nocardioides sp. W3-2-3]|uniref:glycoside hydrolase family 16 protein n=1 Tax=Nocardioides convexus TaxID=2712224 RepID=UPI0024183B02|nr:glycoside hydrolase family 16 protein [Nocardioides convexus]NHA01636.1 glycoside hydrolase family 16 protein [Nocardioides convexus]
MRLSRTGVVLGAGLLALVSVVVLAFWWAQSEPERDRCGERLAKSGGGDWTCTLAEDFTGDRLDEKTWTAAEQVGSQDLCLIDSPRTVAVSGGRLRLSLITADASTPCPLRADGTRALYAGGQVSTYGRWSQQYGRFEARVRVQRADGPGLHEAFWLWPDVRYGADQPWPQTGEIDVAETYSVRPDRAIPFLHSSADAGGPVEGLNTSTDCVAERGQWHTYTLEWTADRLRVAVDGERCLDSADLAATFRKPFIVALTQFMGTGDNLRDPARVPLPATMEVDWVRAWR